MPLAMEVTFDADDTAQYVGTRELLRGLLNRKLSDWEVKWFTGKLNNHRNDY